MHRFASPTTFLRLSRTLLPWLAAACGVCLVSGLYYALAASPADYQQGDTVRIMYIHVPAAWMAMGAYFVMAAASACFLIWRHPLADVAASETAPLGAAFTLICLITGSLWGRPMWGAWWVWDARLTSVLVLLFLYMGYMALENNAGQGMRGRKACAWLAIAGFANLPVIKFSVEWWNTLHQPASLIRGEGPAIHPAMLTPLLLMGAGFSLLYTVLLIVRMQAALLEWKLHRKVSSA